MTMIKLSGLEARVAGIADELSKAQYLLKDASPPAAVHIARAGAAVYDLGADAAGIYANAISTDKRAGDILTQQLGITFMRHYLASQSFLSEAVKFVPNDEPNALAARIDTLLWLTENPSVKAEVMNRVTTAIAQERLRQDRKHGDQLTDSDDVMLRVSLEEVGEVAKAMNEHDPAQMEKEIIEAAACFVKWAEIIEHRRRQQELDNGYEAKNNRPLTPYHTKGYETQPAWQKGDLA